MDVLIMARPDGTMFLRNPIRPKRKDETDEEYLQNIASDNPDGAGLVSVVDSATLPAKHSEFKGARRWKNGAVEIDMPEARKIKMGCIRAERDKRLAATDAAMLKAIETKDPGASTLAAKRQALRDLPATVQPDIDAATDPTSLSAIEPSWPE